MTLERHKRRPKGEKQSPQSYRFDETTVSRVKALSRYYGQSATYLLEELIDSEWEKLKSSDPKGLAKAEKD
jgi:hypothetical protein